MTAKAETAIQRQRRIGDMFRALSHRNFRIIWAGAFVSNTGTWMQAVAQGWLVLELTNSPFWLGVDGFVVLFPGLILTLPAGVVADRYDRRYVLIVTQIFAGLSALTAALLVATGTIQLWMLLALSFVTGCCMSLGAPSFQAITLDLVGRADLSNAIALNSSQFQLSRALGPFVAALTMKLFGLAGCFFANALSFAVIVLSLLRARVERSGKNPETVVSDAGVKLEGAGDAVPKPVAASRPKGGRVFWQDLLAGFGYVKTRPLVRLLLMMTFVMSLCASPYMVMVPLFSRDVLGWGETGLAILLGAAGVGAFCGALMLAFLGEFKGRGLFVLASAFAASGCIIGFSFSTLRTLSTLLLFLTGFSMVCFFAMTNTLLQHLVAEEMRGRVLSMFITVLGAMPVGSLLAGAAAERLGAPHTLSAGGAIIALIAVYVALRHPRLREL